MTVFTAGVRGALPTIGATTDITFGASFGQPVAVCFIVSGGTTDGTESARPCVSIGWADGTRNRVFAYGVEDATVSGRENGWNFASRNGIIAVPNQAGGNDGLFSFNSWITNGVRLNIDTAPSLAYKYIAFAVNGDGVQAYVGDFGSVTNGISTSVTAPGFQPDLIDFFGLGAFSASPTWNAPGQVSRGWAVRTPGLMQVGGGWINVDNTITTDVEAFVSDLYIQQTISAATLIRNTYVSGFASNGFTLDNTDMTNNALGGGYCAMKLPGVRVWCGIVDTPTSTGIATIQTSTSSPATPGFEAQALFGFLTALTTSNALVGTQLGTEDSASSACHALAAGRGTVVDGSANVRERDFKTLPFSAGGLADDKFGHVLKGDATDAIVADFDARQRNGFSLNYTTVLGSAAKWPIAAIGYGRSMVTRPNRINRHLLGR